ncbi:MAG: hypothetical protein FJ098_02065 [Deltaproteobacteria bacterium]|nr:hypothetical protein [Deltaproteobacteria bacterium]
MHLFRVIILYFVVIGLVVAGLIAHIDAERSEFLQQDLKPSLEATARTYQGMTSQRFSQLEEFVRDVGRSDLIAYLDALHGVRGTIRDVGSKCREAFPGLRGPTNDAMEQRLKQFVQDEAGPAVDRFRGALRERLRDIPEGISREDYVTKLGDILVSCMAEREPMDICYFKLTYVPLTLALFDRLAEIHKEHLPQLFLLVDEDGQNGRIDIRNLSGQLRSGRQADLFRETAQYDAHRIQSFGRYLPQLDLLRSSDETTRSVLFSDVQNKTYLAVVHKLVSGDGAIRGYVVAGFEVDEVLAKQDTRSVMGVRPLLERCEEYRFAGEEPGDEEPLSEEMCEHEAGLQVSALTFLHRTASGSLEVRGSSLAGTGGEEVARLVSRSPDRPLLEDERFVVGTLDVGVDDSKPGERLIAALTVDRKNATRFYDGVCLRILFAGVGVFLMGLLLMVWMIRASRRPYEAIDAAVHEVISGNLEHPIPFQFREELPSSLGQSLAVMRAVLLGEPLPEDRELDQSWAQGLIVVGGDGSQAAVDEDTGEVPMALEAPVVREKDLKETRTEYYQRIYKEFLAAKRSLGEDTSSITFASFVDRLVRTEKSLREKLQCKAVRFRVEVKNTQVALLPVRIEE